jgi:urease accessory protein
VLSDLLVINKTDLAPYVGADVDLMVREARAVRGEKPIYLTNCRTGEGVDAVLEQVLHDALVAKPAR